VIAVLSAVWGNEAKWGTGCGPVSSLRSDVQQRQEEEIRKERGTEQEGVKEEAQIGKE
jgi:hypothetical protein